jgi:hypothetical protein
VVLIFINNSARRHHLEENLKDDSLRSEKVGYSGHMCDPRPKGAPRKLVAGANFVIQESQIGDWELAINNLALSNDEDGLHAITHPLGSK